MENKKIRSLIAGPTDKTKIFRFGKIKKEDYPAFIEGIGHCLVEGLSRLDLIPDEGVPLDIARAYKRLGGEQVVGYVPLGGCESLRPYFEVCDTVEEFDSGWSGLNTCLSLRSGNIISVGMSPGTMVELAYTKYHGKYMGNNIPLLIDLRAIEGRLPLAVEDEVDARYFDSNKQLMELLGDLRK